MCYTPVTIKNLNYCSHSSVIQMLKNTKDVRIQVPCGKCPACRSRKQTDLLQRVQMESLNSYIFFFTLTYNNDQVPRYTLPDGHTLMCSNYKHLVDMFKRIRKQKYFGDRKFKYLVTEEYGSRKARPHVHGLLFIQKLPTDTRFSYMALEEIGFKTLLHEWRVNVARTVAKRDTKRYKMGDIIPNTRHPEYVPLCTYVRRFYGGRMHTTYDFHYVTPLTSSGHNDVSFYVTKYLFKDSKSIKYIQKSCYAAFPDNKVEAMDVYQKHFKPCSRKSTNFGHVWTDESYSDYRNCHNPLALTYSKEVSDYLLEMCRIAVSQHSPIKFYDLYTGKPLPICKYFLDKLPDNYQVYHYKTALKYYESKPFDSVIQKTRSDITRFNNSNRVSDRSLLTDLFDNDQLLDIY